MGCFSLAWFESLCIWLIVVFAIVGIIRLLIPYLTGFLPSIVGEIVNIILWAIVAIMVVYIVFALLSCLISMGGGIHLLPR